MLSIIASWAYTLLGAKELMVHLHWGSLGLIGVVIVVAYTQYLE